MTTLIWFLLVFEGYQNIANIRPIDDYDCQTTPYMFEADMPPPDYLRIKGVVCCEEKCVIDLNVG